MSNERTASENDHHHFETLIKIAAIPAAQIEVRQPRYTKAEILAEYNHALMQSLPFKNVFALRTVRNLTRQTIFRLMSTHQKAFGF